MEKYNYTIQSATFAKIIQTQKKKESENTFGKWENVQGILDNPPHPPNGNCSVHQTEVVGPTEFLQEIPHCRCHCQISDYQDCRLCLTFG